MTTTEMTIDDYTTSTTTSLGKITDNTAQHRQPTTTTHHYVQGPPRGLATPRSAPGLPMKYDIYKTTNQQATQLQR